MITSSRLHRMAPRAAAAFLALITLHGCDSAGAGATAPTADGTDLALFRDGVKQAARSYVEPVTVSILVKDDLKGKVTRLNTPSDYMDQSHHYQLTSSIRATSA